MAGGRGRSGRKPAEPRADVIPDDGGPKCPKEANKRVQQKWALIVSQLPNGVLRRIDGHQLLILCHLLAGVDELTAAIDSDPLDNQSRRTLLQYSDRVNKLSAMFGLSPADRMRIKVGDNPAAKDELDEWREQT